MTIDLRSDTVTRPSAGMLEAMHRAKVGDDVFSEDPSVNELQDHAAEMFGMEAALFCPSGTMTNQIAIKARTQPGDEVICEAGAHLHYYEGGGMAFNSGVAAKPIKGDRGVFTAGQVMEELRPENVHFPNTALVSIENTCNRGGGRIYGFEEIEKLRSLCDEHGLAFHLDGARLFNAMVAEGRSPKEFGDLFDTVSICLSKGLGAPVGSLLLGKRELISKALRIRKVLGGGMRQAGYLAAAGLYALRNNIERLRSDHQLATALGECLEQLNYITGVLPVETNMIVFGLDEHVETSAFLAYLEQNGILAFEVGKHRIRFVTHLDLPGSTFEVVRQALRNYVPD